MKNTLTQSRRLTQIGMLVITAIVFLSACSAKKDTTDTPVAQVEVAKEKDSISEEKIKDLKPKGEKPAWAEGITDNMMVVMERLAEFKAAPIETLSAKAARKNPTPTDAVMEVMKENSIAKPTSKVDTTSENIDVKGGKIHLRIYTPLGNGPFPVIVYYHGGGWVIANLDTYEGSARGLAEQTNAVVVSVAYRQGPEHKFPTAHNDSYAAYEWVTKNTKSLKGDTSRIAVVGESAGGNLAANVSIMARDKGYKKPIYQVLIYPIANNDMNSESYKKNAKAMPLNKPMMAWFMKNYLPKVSMSSDPRIALVKANLKDLPPTTIITAEIDPLLSDGELLRDKLKDAKVDVNYKQYDGVTHEFFGMAAVVPEAKEAQEFVVMDLKDAFEKPANK